MVLFGDRWRNSLGQWCPGRVGEERHLRAQMTADELEDGQLGVQKQQEASLQVYPCLSQVFGSVLFQPCDFEKVA